MSLLKTVNIDALILDFEIIREAANRLPDNFKDQHVNID